MSDLNTPARDEMIEKILAKVKIASDEDLEQVAELLKVDEEIPAAVDAPIVLPKPGIVDTAVLTGSRGGLKNFLLKSERDNESKS